MKIDELLVGLGFDYESEEMESFKKDLKTSVNLIKKLAKVAATAAVALTGLTIASTKASDEQGKLADEIGDTVENITALQFAQQRAGGSTEEMTSALRDFSIRSAEAARGTGSALEAFGILGISAEGVGGKLRPLSDVLIEVAQKFQGLSRVKQIELADKLGLKGSIRLLQQGPVAIQALIKEANLLGVTTAKDAMIAAEFQDSLTDLSTIFKQIGRTISQQVAPILTDLIKMFTEWWKVNRDIIEQKLPVWINRLAIAFKFAAIAIASFIAFKIIANMALMLGIIIKMVKWVTLFAARALIIPAVIGAIALGFLALVQDAKVFFEGGESFIGDMIKKYPQWADVIKVIAAVLATIADVTMKIFDGWSRIISLFSKFSLDNVKEVFKNLPGFIGEIFSEVKAIFNMTMKIFDGWARIINLFNKFSLNNVKEVFGNIPGFIGDVFGFGGNNDVLPSVNNAVSNATSTKIDKIEIIVNGGNDSKESIAEAVKNQFQQTAQDLNSSVAY